MVLSEALINDFTTTLQNGSMPGVIYDTAVIAAIKDETQVPRFPELVQAVIDNQRKDGSWGTDYIQPYDRLLNTASALYMITELNLHKIEKRANDSLNNGVQYLEEHHKAFLQSDAAMPAAFEFLYPYFLSNIMSKTRELTISISSLERIREQKLERVQSQIFKNPTPLLHSMEGIITDKESAQKIRQFQETNGSLAASPASTSIFLKYKIKEAIPKAMKYIQSMIQENGLIKHFDDYIYMNIAFSLYPLFKARYNFSYEAIPSIHLLHEDWTGQGVPFGKSFPVADADDTAVSIVVLSYSGLVDIDERIPALLSYETDGHFLTYPFELTPSIMTNMHVLDALLLSPQYNTSEYVFKVLDFIKKQTQNGFYLKGNKYNASSVIQTSNIILTLLPYLRELGEGYTNWLLKRFNWDTGMWGSDLGRNGTIEETAHALLALGWARTHGMEVDKEIMKKAYDTLIEKTNHCTRFQFSDLWTAKVQYSPIEINKAHVLAACYLYEQIRN